MNRRAQCRPDSAGDGQAFPGYAPSGFVACCPTQVLGAGLVVGLVLGLVVGLIVGRAQGTDGKLTRTVTRLGMARTVAEPFEEDSVKRGPPPPWPCSLRRRSTARR